MNDPIKVIFKFKNNNSRLQYHIYIYIGNIPSTILTILNKIKTLSFYDTLLTLSVNEYDRLTKYYGEYWYTKFFNTYHVASIIDKIIKNNEYIKKLTNKYGKDWLEQHIKKYKLSKKKIFYKYDTVIKNEILRKEMRKKRLQHHKEDILLDYTTKKNLDIQNIFSPTITNKTFSDTKENSYENDNIQLIHALHTHTINKNMKGGQYDYSEDIDEDNDGVIEFEEGLDQDQNLEGEELEDLDIDEIEKIYQDMDVQKDDNINKTSNLIKIAMKDDKILKKHQNKMVDFDTSKDNLMYDENLKNVYYKNYITNQYIFKDDTIKIIKNKICCSIKNNPKFEKNAYIIPSRQYLWSEYYFNNNIEKIMIGQKWIKRTNILHIDIEPNPNIKWYEELRGNLKLLKDNIKRYGSKIKREDDDFNILYDYDYYVTNNEIYLLDIYNELGKNYSITEDILKNITDVFIKIYFPRIKTDDIKYIIDYLNGNTKVESNKILTIYETINNDLIVENQIMNDVESVKKTSIYKNIFKENYITQSVIHVNLRLLDNTKIDLFRIFNEFTMIHKYPFIQYQTIDGQIIFKYSEKYIEEFSRKKDNINVLSKWFENAPYGISFKIRINGNNKSDQEKFMAINLNDNGRIEYKTQWKEDDMATIDDIKNTYNYVRDLIKKINMEKNKVKIDIPKDIEFKYAFINSIQKFILPDRFIINHNDLSEFSRYFYPYIALVVEPRKRQAKIKKDIEKSKFGTYLRYKRVSKYENQARIEQRILYFMRNYDYNDQSLSNEIGKQFNITIERAMEEIERVRNKYPLIRKSRKILKKLENIPKYKPPGIGIDIQGKTRERYKIRISGARDKDQLNRIIIFMNILIFLYVETYLYKKPERQIFKEKLKKLTNIAHRRNKVEDIVDYEKESKTVKQMTAMDKKRIGFKPEKGQNQWTRSCQNSGKDKKRRPQQYITVYDLLANGFKLNKDTGLYEKKVKIKQKNKQREITIRAVGLKSTTEANTEIVYYTCNPKDNGEHMFVGFLSRSNNPYGQCMPCCFKKDAYLSINKSKKDYYLKCIGQIKKKEVIEKSDIIGDQLYILQDTNKIQEGRFGLLSKYLDFYMNRALNKVRKIKNHYLIETKTGYFFKYGSKQDFPFLNGICIILDITLDELKNIIIDKLEKDKKDVLFTALNNGDIRTRFKTRNNFINFIEKNDILPFSLFNHLLCIPGVLKKFGMNIIVFNKKTTIIKKALEKEKVREDFTILCQNAEEIENLTDENRDTIFMIKENRNFYPIIMVTKKDSNSKNIDIQKIFKYDKSDETNIINYVINFYNTNCNTDIFDHIKNKKNNIIAKYINKILSNLQDKNFHPKYQVIDSRNKCKYLITNNGTIIPTKQSGSIYNLLITNISTNKLQNLKTTLDNLKKLYILLNKKLPINPIGLYYDKKNNNEATIIAIMTEIYTNVPILSESVNISWINSNGYVLENKQLYDKIDEEIVKGKENYNLDKRIINTNFDKYYRESYELFRLELSTFINESNNENIKNKIIRIINNKYVPKKNKRISIRSLLYKLIDKNIFTLYKQYQNNIQKGGKSHSKFVHVTKTYPDISNYNIVNNREICNINNTKDKCNDNIHCYWSHDNCHFAITKDMVINFVNRISEELASNSMKAQEILQKDNYFVSDIVDYNRFTQKPNQKIIKSTNTAINKELTNIFGKGNIPKIGRKKIIKTATNYEDMNIQNSLKDMGDFYIQNIINNNITLYRAYSNGFFWLKNTYYAISNRNLGFYSNLQTDMANYFRSITIDWLTDNKNKEFIKNNLLKYVNNKISKETIKNVDNKITTFINKISKDINNNTNCVIELYILSKIYNIPIIIYNNENSIIYIFDDKLIYNSITDKNINLFSNKQYSKYLDTNNIKNSINMKFSFIGSNDIPHKIDIIYYK